MASPSSSSSKLVAVFLAGTLFGAFSAVQVAPRLTTAQPTIVAQGTSPGPTVTTPLDGAPVEGPTTVTDPSRTKDKGTPVRSGLECAKGRNGGATDIGVTADKIMLATTVVQSGIGAAFLGDVKYAMEAVKNKVNRAGGICGRHLDIKYVDDGWDAQRGASYLRNFIKEGVFAIPVAPSSEGLRVVVDSGDIEKAGIPVVGTDGMLLDQYQRPNGAAQSWVWSVAVATASTARIMARDAHKRGARTFSIVFDKNYKFGVEAAAAYNAEVKRLTGKNVQGYNKENNCSASYCGVLAGQSSYSSEIQQFQHADFEAMFLEPTTALTWMATPGAPTPKTVTYGIGAAQPLFTRAFGNGCQKACDQMAVWTSYKPPIEELLNDPIVSTYVQDLEKTKPDADEANAFAEGGYVGMMLLVDALKRVGPGLTRAALRRELDALKFGSGLTIQDQLAWSPTDHFANATMQAFTMEYKGTFSGWRPAQVVTDPTPQRGVS